MAGHPSGAKGDGSRQAAGAFWQSTLTQCGLGSTYPLPGRSPESPVPTYSTKTSSTNSVWGRDGGREVSCCRAQGTQLPRGLGMGQQEGHVSDLTSF